MSIIRSDLTAPRKRISSEISCKHGVSNRDPSSMPKISHATGLPAHVLHLQWPAGVNPAQLPNFETEARRLRYQALGIACRNRQIPYLLMAHHEDDQAETILLRLFQGHRLLGLRGMEPLARIPDCEDIHGVHQSGLRERNEYIKSGKLLDLLQKKPRSSMSFEAAIPFEDGGITIHRPLLNFSKDRLIATCKDSGVQWVEDHTNRDPTQTPRNAIRQLLQDGRLPRSLQKPSLLALRNRMYLKSAQRLNRADLKFQRCHIIMLDTRVGSMVVRLPKRINNLYGVPPDYRQKHVVKGQFIAAFLLRQLLDIVSPRRNTSLEKLEFAVNLIFPGLENPAATNLDKFLLPSKFVVGGVSFERVHAPWQLSEESNHPKYSNSLDPDFIWALTRQPFSTGETPTIEISPARKSPTPESQPIPDLDPSKPSSLLTQSAFQLWDLRYWIRVYNPTSCTLRVQPLREETLRQLRSSQTAEEAKEFDRLVRDAAPGKIRYTLPVLVQEQDGIEKVVALPTLGWGVSSREKGVMWEVRYKKVTLPRQTDVSRVVI